MLSSLRPGHSHEDINQTFGRLASFLVRHGHSCQTPDDFQRVIQQFLNEASFPHEPVSNRYCVKVDQTRDWSLVGVLRVVCFCLEYRMNIFSMVLWQFYVHTCAHVFILQRRVWLLWLHSCWPCQGKVFWHKQFRCIFEVSEDQGHRTSSCSRDVVIAAAKLSDVGQIIQFLVDCNFTRLEVSSFCFICFFLICCSNIIDSVRAWCAYFSILDSRFEPWRNFWRLLEAETWGRRCGWCHSEAPWIMFYIVCLQLII